MKLFGYGGQEPLEADEMLRLYTNLGAIPKPPQSDVDEDLHLAQVAHSADDEKRTQSAERGVEALRRQDGSIE